MTWPSCSCSPHPEQETDSAAALAGAAVDAVVVVVSAADVDRYDSETLSPRWGDHRRRRRRRCCWPVKSVLLPAAADVDWGSCSPVGWVEPPLLSAPLVHHPPAPGGQANIHHCRQAPTAGTGGQRWRWVWWV